MLTITFLSNSTSAVWKNIFVDAEPMKGWQHDCYVFDYT